MISKLLFLLGVLCIGVYGFFAVQAHFRQQELQQELQQHLYQPLNLPMPPAVKPARPKKLEEGDLFGRLEIPRLNLSVMVMEGDEDDVLRLGAGHVPGTPLAIAGHRDTFFRPLKDIKLNDDIVFTTLEGSSEYHVVSTKIVGPRDTWVLDGHSADTLTLITCYPFYYIGSAPKRFIVEAAKK